MYLITFHHKTSVSMRRLEYGNNTWKLSDSEEKVAWNVTLGWSTVRAWQGGWFDVCMCASPRLYVHFCALWCACVQGKGCVCSHLFVRFTPMDCRDCVLCRLHYLIRMNFSNNPLLARVDHKGKTKTGPSFITFLLPQYLSFFKFRLLLFTLWSCLSK